MKQIKRRFWLIYWDQICLTSLLSNILISRDQLDTHFASCISDDRWLDWIDQLNVLNMCLLSEVDDVDLVRFESFNACVIKLKRISKCQLLACLDHDFSWMNRFFLDDSKWLIDQNENVVCLHVYYAHTNMIDDSVFSDDVQQTWIVCKLSHFQFINMMIVISFESMIVCFRYVV